MSAAIKLELDKDDVDWILYGLDCVLNRYCTDEECETDTTAVQDRIKAQALEQGVVFE